MSTYFMSFQCFSRERMLLRRRDPVYPDQEDEERQKSQVFQPQLHQLCRQQAGL